MITVFVRIKLDIASTKGAYSKSAITVCVYIKKNQIRSNKKYESIYTN